MAHTQCAILTVADQNARRVRTRRNLDRERLRRPHSTPGELPGASEAFTLAESPERTNSTVSQQSNRRRSRTLSAAHTARDCASDVRNSKSKEEYTESSWLSASISSENESRQRKYSPSKRRPASQASVRSTADDRTEQWSGARHPVYQDPSKQSLERMSQSQRRKQVNTATPTKRSMLPSETVAIRAGSSEREGEFLDGEFQADSAASSSFSPSRATKRPSSAAGFLQAWPFYEDQILRPTDPSRNADVRAEHFVEGRNVLSSSAVCQQCPQSSEVRARSTAAAHDLSSSASISSFGAPLHSTNEHVSNSYGDKLPEILLSGEGNEGLAKGKVLAHRSQKVATSELELPPARNHRQIDRQSTFGKPSHAAPHGSAAPRKSSSQREFLVSYGTNVHPSPLIPSVHRSTVFGDDERSQSQETIMAAYASSLRPQSEKQSHTPLEIFKRQF